MGRLAGQVAIVAGASTGMGAATARLFAAEGAAVVAAARNAAKLAEVVDAITASGGTAAAVPTDATDREAVQRLVEQAVERHGRVDILVNSVGTNIKNRAFTQMRPEDWDMMVAANLDAAYNLTHAVLPTMRAQGHGNIVHVSSDSVQKPNTVAGIAYQATKHGVRGLALGTMAEEKQNGIRVGVVYPGVCNTPLLEKRPTPPPREAFGKMLEPEDVAEAVLFMAALPARAYIPELILATALI